jgi:hypothetical protein
MVAEVYAFLTVAADGCEWATSHYRGFIPEEGAPVPTGWISIRASLHVGNSLLFVNTIHKTDNIITDYSVIKYECIENVVSSCREQLF